MSINALFDEFKVKAATPKQQLAEYKAQGKKVIGVLPYYAPEELVYAAGMVPMGIWGSQTESYQVRAYVPAFCCPIMQQQDDQPCKRVLCNLLLHDRSART